MLVYLGESGQFDKCVVEDLLEAYGDGTDDSHLTDGSENLDQMAMLKTPTVMLKILPPMLGWQKVLNKPVEDVLRMFWMCRRGPCVHLVKTRQPRPWTPGTIGLQRPTNCSTGRHRWVQRGWQDCPEEAPRA